MAEVNFDNVCPQCNKPIKQNDDTDIKLILTCPHCKSPLYKSAVDSVQSAVDTLTNKLKGDLPMYPSGHIRDLIASMSRRPDIPEVKHFSHWLSGDAAFIALKEAVDELVTSAPKDHDVLVQAFNISVREIRYVEPHTFLFSGFNDIGHHTAVVAHYSQVVAHIVYLPKQGPERIITGFSRQKDE